MGVVIKVFIEENKNNLNLVLLKNEEERDRATENKSNIIADLILSLGPSEGDRVTTYSKRSATLRKSSKADKKETVTVQLEETEKSLEGDVSCAPDSFGSNSAAESQVCRKIRTVNVIAKHRNTVYELTPNKALLKEDASVLRVVHQEVCLTPENGIGINVGAGSIQNIHSVKNGDSELVSLQHTSNQERTLKSAASTEKVVPSTPSNNTEVKIRTEGRLSFSKSLPESNKGKESGSLRHYDKRLVCSFCGYTTCRINVFREHQRIHTGEKPFSCSHCYYRTASKPNLIRHQRRHTGEKPFKCSLCDYSSSLKSTLLSHQRVHSGEKPYSCRICDYKSIHRFNMIRHERVHTGERPFICSVCSHRSASKLELKVHLQTHNSAKYECALCGYTCKRKRVLIVHVKMCCKKKNRLL